jgi:hypothetical protein
VLEQRWNGDSSGNQKAECTPVRRGDMLGHGSTINLPPLQDKRRPNNALEIGPCADDKKEEAVRLASNMADNPHKSTPGCFTIRKNHHDKPLRRLDRNISHGSIEIGQRRSGRDLANNRGVREEQQGQKANQSKARRRADTDDR